MEGVVPAEVSIPKDKRIVGIELLRFYMAFMVVVTHLGGTILYRIEHVLYIFQAFHVTVFMLLSFLLCGKYFLDPSKESTKKRAIRIVLPIVVWGLISFVVTLIWNLCFYKVPSLTFKDLCWQLLTGHSGGINTPLWFLVDMLWISCLLWLLRLILKKKYFAIALALVMAVCFVLQYTGANYVMFGNLPYELKYPLGRMIEMIPYANIGVLCSILIPWLQEKKFKLHIILFISSLVLVALCIFIKWRFVNYSIQGFGYNGLYLMIGSILLMVMALTSPLNFVNNERFKCIVKWITSFTMGVYCMHVVFGKIVEGIFIKYGIMTQTIWVCLLVYIIGYAVSFVISLIPSKNIQNLVK